MEEEINSKKRRWKLALGELDQDNDLLPARDKQIDHTLERLYGSDRLGGNTPGNPISDKWIGDIHALFPESVIQIIQKDSLDRFGIRKMLSQPEFIRDFQPTPALLATILSAKDQLTPVMLESVRIWINKLAKEVEERLRFRLISLLTGSLDHSRRLRNPRLIHPDWNATIRANLKHYQHDLKTIIPEIIWGKPRRRVQSKKLIILVDQSASMAESVIYAGILGSVLSKITSLKTHLAVFDTEVYDLSDELKNVASLLLSTRLGGGTHIVKALEFALTLGKDDPRETFIVLITDLFEGAPEPLLLEHTEWLIAQGFRLIILLALDDKGRPVYHAELAKKMASLGVPCFASTPDLFPEHISTLLNGGEFPLFSGSS